MTCNLPVKGTVSGVWEFPTMWAPKHCSLSIIHCICTQLQSMLTIANHPNNNCKPFLMPLWWPYPATRLRLVTNSPCSCCQQEPPYLGSHQGHMLCMLYGLMSSIRIGYIAIIWIHFSFVLWYKIAFIPKYPCWSWLLIYMSAFLGQILSHKIIEISMIIVKTNRYIPRVHNFSYT